MVHAENARFNPMIKPLKTSTALLLPLLTLALGWQLGVHSQAKALSALREQWETDFRGGTGSTVQDPEEEVDLSLLWAAWRLMLRHYIAPDQLRTEPMLFGAVKGMVDAVGDPYTLFMTPEENEEFRDALSGSLEGIGAELALRDGNVVVVAPLRKSPAERAGLQPGDIIVEVNGESTENLTLQQTVQRIRGPQGTTVTLTVAREAAEDLLTVAIVRESIHVPSVEWRTEGSGGDAVGVIAVNQFGDDTTAELRDAIATLQRDSVRGLVLDLRNNGGGYLDGAVDMVSLFLRQGKVVTVERREGQPQHHYVSGRPLLPDLPMVVLINGGSASAAEITAGALHDNKRAALLGSVSFGKGTVQEVIDLPGGSSLRVTVARWLTPSGHDLSKKGIEPTYAVEPSETPGEDDAQLKAALEFLRTGKPPAARA